MSFGPTNDAPWDPISVSEPADDTFPVPLAFFNTLGEVDLLDLAFPYQI